MAPDPTRSGAFLCQIAGGGARRSAALLAVRGGAGEALKRKAIVPRDAAPPLAHGAPIRSTVRRNHRFSENRHGSSSSRCLQKSWLGNPTRSPASCDKMPGGRQLAALDLQDYLAKSHGRRLATVGACEEKTDAKRAFLGWRCPWQPHLFPAWVLRAPSIQRAEFWRTPQFIVAVERRGVVDQVAGLLR